MKRRVIGGAVGVAVVVAVFVFVLPRVADYGAVWRAVRQLGWEQLVALAAAQLFNLSTYAPPFMAALPGLDYWRASVITQASTASTYVAPGGAAVGMGVSYAMLKGWGFAPAAITLAVTVTGVWNQLFMLGAPTVAVVLLTWAGGSSPALQTLATVGLVVFAAAVAALAAAFASSVLARRIGNLAALLANRVLGWIRRGPVTWSGESLVRFRLQAIGLLRRRWLPLTAATAAGQLSVYLVLVVCLRAVGVDASQVTLTEAFAAWTFIRLVGSVPITPGGLGVVELGLTGTLVGFGGKSGLVVAAVLIYRVLTVVPTLVLGVVATGLWRQLRP